MGGGAVWRARTAWVGGTLLLAVAISFFCGLVLSDLRGFQGNGGALEGVASSIFSLAAAVLLRTYWPEIRAWSRLSDEWTVRHPTLTIAATAVAFSLLGGLLNRDLIAAGGGLPIGAVLGWLSVRRATRRRQRPDELDA
jgi:membrane associated rhomboid family serine protease